MKIDTLPRPWRFFRAGGFDQVRIETGADLLSIDNLDQKLWMALACPTEGVDFPADTLACLDGDRDGRIRATDLEDAVRWLRKIVADPAELETGGDGFRLAAIKDSSPEGAVLLSSARSILAGLGRPEADTIVLADVEDKGRVFGQTRFNGDGIIPAEAAEDQEVAAVVRDVIACFGAVEDRSGLPGIDQGRIDAFYRQVQDFAAWQARREELAPIPELGRHAEEAADALEAVRAEIDGYFLRCDLASFSQAAAGAANPPPESFAPLLDKAAGECLERLASFPLAEIRPGGALPLEAGLNPAWTDAIGRFRRVVVLPLLGDADRLSRSDWEGIKTRLAAHAAWRAGRPGADILRLGAERIRAIHDSVPKEKLDALIAADTALEAEAAAIDDVRRLLLYKRDLLRLVNNFVSFREFYSRSGWAIFQAGRLFIDGRSAELCVRVEDVAKHAQLATLSRICLVYCRCVRCGGSESAFIAAAITAGDSDQLMVGRNGVFYDRQGRDWDATIVKVLDHPIGLRQAFWSPYRQVARFVGEQIEKMAAAKAKAVETQMTAAVAKPPGAQPAPFDAGKFAGIFAALGLAVGAIGTAIASIVTGFLGLPWWQMPLALAGLLLMISGPSMLIAFMKLRQRSLAPILDASGWAVNGRAKINIPFGGTLTGTAKLPEGAERSLKDPYAERGTPWTLYAVLAALAGAALLAWRMGVL